jgi:photosystem II stability/assembly factor-like uncharacterized protein
MMSNDGGVTLKECNVGFTNRNFTALAGSGMALYVNSVFEAASGGIYRSDTLGLRWARQGLPAGDSILAVSVSPEDPKVVWAATYHGLIGSEDGGKTWKPRKSPPGERIATLLALSDKTVLTGTSDGIYRTNDGATWIQSGMGGVVSLRGTATGTSSTHMISALMSQGAMASADNGATWAKCGAIENGATWYGVDFDSGASNTALAATSAGLYRSTDGCHTWKPVLSGLRQETASLVVFHPVRSGEAYVSQGGRIFRSADGGQRWLPLDDGAQGNSGPASLVVLPASPDRLFALFPRRGVLSISIKENQFQ